MRLKPESFALTQLLLVFGTLFALVILGFKDAPVSPRISHQTFLTDRSSQPPESDTISAPPATRAPAFVIEPIRDGEGSVD